MLSDLNLIGVHADGPVVWRISGVHFTQPTMTYERKGGKFFKSCKYTNFFHSSYCQPCYTHSFRAVLYQVSRYKSQKVGYKIFSFSENTIYFNFLFNWLYEFSVLLAFHSVQNGRKFCTSWLQETYFTFHFFKLSIVTTLVDCWDT